MIWRNYSYRWLSNIKEKEKEELNKQSKNKGKGQSDFKLPSHVAKLSNSPPHQNNQSKSSKK